MCPKALIVACPCRRVFLGTAIARSCDDKRSFTGKRLPAFISRFGHIVAVNIVHFSVGGSSVFVCKNNVVRERAIETGRFVHIVPDTADAERSIELQMLSPPFPNGRTAEVRIYCITRPDGVDIDAAVRRFGKKVVFDAFFIHRIIFFHLDARVNNRNGFDTLFFQVGKQRSRVVIVFPVPGKDLVAFHIVDVKVERVTGNPQRTQF